MGQPAAQFERVGAPFVPAQAAALQIGLDIRGLHGAGQAHVALQRAGQLGQQVVQLQRLQLRTDVDAVANAAAGAHPAVAHAQGEIALALVAAQDEMAVARQRASAQASAQRLHVGLRVEAATVACAAGGGDAAIEVSVPAWREIAGVEAVQDQRQVPVQRRVPAGFAGGLQPAAGHRRLQRMDRRPCLVAAQVQHQVRMLVAASQRRIAVGGPPVDGAG